MSPLDYNSNAGTALTRQGLGVLTNEIFQSSTSFEQVWWVARRVVEDMSALQRRIRSAVALASLTASPALEPRPMVGCISAAHSHRPVFTRGRRSPGPRPVRGFGRRGR